MKKFILIILIILPIFLLSNEEHDFRNADWGMTKWEVRLSEGKRKMISEKEETITYIDTIANNRYVVVYNFFNDELCFAGYMSIEQYTNKNSYIDDYMKLKEILIDKYGEPDDKWWLNNSDYNEIVWLNDLYKDDPEHWGLAISMGYLGYQNCWTINGTSIALKLSGNNYKIDLGIVYNCIERYKEYIKAKTEIEKSKL